MLFFGNMKLKCKRSDYGSPSYDIFINRRYLKFAGIMSCPNRTLDPRSYYKNNSEIPYAVKW